MNLTRDEAAERAGHLAVQGYDVTLDVTTGEEVFRSTTVLTFTTSRPGSSTFVDLVARTVHEVTLNGRSLDPAEVADGVRIRLDDLAAENELRVVADCRYMNTGEGLHRFVDPVDNEVYLYSQFEVADSRRVFAVFEQPDLKARFTFTVTAPDHWVVVSACPTPEPTPGAADGSPRDGVATWRFAPTPVLSSYVNSVVAGPYHRETSKVTSTDGRTIPLGVFCRRSLAEYLDADELWLNESFAEWASTMAQAENTRWPWAWTTFGTAEKSWAYRQDQLPSTHPIVADIRDLEDVEVNFDGITYAKGASVLKQLVAYVGQDAFVEGLRQYFRTHAWGNTELSDLLLELEATSGRDLRGWSALWLQRAGVNTLSPEVEGNDDGTLRSVTIVQSAPVAHAVLRPHRLAVGCYDLVDGRLRRTSRVEVDVVGERTDVPALAGRRRPDLLLVNDDDLGYAKIRLDQHSFETGVRHLDAFADSMPRSLVLGAAWDMTRDAETPARAFVELVLRAVATESDSTVLRLLLAQLSTTVRMYVAREHREDVRAHVGECLHELAVAAEPGSDRQLQLVTAFAAQATSPEQVAVVRGLLDGSQPLKGLAVDTDMRWSLLTSLVAAGGAGEAEIEAELRRDPTADGQRAAAAARAAVPSADAKQAAWNGVVESPDLPNAVQESVIHGFSRVHDGELLRSFVKPYFAAIERVWAERTNEIAQQVVVGLYPTVLADEELLDASDAWLNGASDAVPALRRLVSENRDAVARALRVQARDHEA